MSNSSALHVSRVEFSPACFADRRSPGLLGWTSFVLGGSLLVDGVAIRRTRKGTIALSFPEFDTGRGRRKRPVRPLDDNARREIERQVLDAIDIGTRGAL